MKNKRVLVLTGGLTAVIVIVLVFGPKYLTERTQWERDWANRQATEHIQKRYNESLKVTDTRYNFKEGYFYVLLAYPLNELKLDVVVRVYDNGDIEDNYESVVVKERMEGKIHEVLNALYSDHLSYSYTTFEPQFSTENTLPIISLEVNVKKTFIPREDGEKIRQVRDFIKTNRYRINGITFIFEEEGAGRKVLKLD